MKIYSVYDSKASAYLLPIYQRTAGEALRAFQSECENKESNFYKYASDFTLVELGDFDELSAKISSHDKPVILANASEFKKD